MNDAYDNEQTDREIARRYGADADDWAEVLSDVVRLARLWRRSTRYASHAEQVAMLAQLGQAIDRLERQS